MTKAAKLFVALALGVIQAITSDKRELGQRKRLADLNPHVPELVITKLGAELLYAEGALRVKGWACPACDARTDTKTGAPAIIKGPSSYPDKPSAFHCDSCQHNLGTISKIIELFVDQWRDQLRLLRETQGTDPVEEFWTVAAYGDDIGYARFTETAIETVLPSENECSIRLLKIRAVDVDQVKSLMNDPAVLDCAVSVELDTQGRPLTLWCDERAWRNEDASALHAAQFDRRKELELVIDAELEQERARRLQEAGL